MPAREKFLLVGLVAAFLGVALAQNVPKIAPWNYHFGAEYGNIAASIVRGEGYGSPFEDNDVPANTGASAWMPPIFTYFLAAIFSVFGIKSAASVWALLVFKYVSLSVAALLLFRICIDTSRGNWPYLVLPIYLFHIRYSFDAFFRTTHDAWLGILVVAALLYSHHRRVIGGQPLNWAWGALGGIAILVNPVLGPVFVVLTLLPFKGGSWSRRAAMFLIAAAIVAPWVLRNYVVFERFIPVKSNMYFDLYQSNYLDDDGILDKRTFAEFHPYENAKVFEEYASLGEVEFMDRYRQAFSSGLRADPLVFVRKSWNRALAVFLRFPIFEHKGEIWGWTGRVKQVTYAFPFLFASFLLWTGRKRLEPTIAAVLVVFFLYFLPYVFIGYYQRYRLPMVPVFSLLYFFTLVRIAERPVPRKLAEIASGTKRWWIANFDMSGRGVP